MLHLTTPGMLKKHSLKDGVEASENIHLIPPAGYFDMLALMKSAEFILTDSGGIQEEATSPVLEKQVFVMRTTTERPEAVKAGFCKVVGTDSSTVLKELMQFVSGPRPTLGACPYGDGNAGEMIASILREEL